jgi:hypothetical protein
VLERIKRRLDKMVVYRSDKVVLIIFYVMAVVWTLDKLVQGILWLFF